MFSCSEKINIKKTHASIFNKRLDGLLPFNYFSRYDYEDSSWKSDFQFTDENHQAIEWRIMPALKAARKNNFSEKGWIYAGIGYDKTSREIYFGLTFERGDILPSIELISCESGDISEDGYDVSDFIFFSPQMKFWIEPEIVPSKEWLQEFVLTKKTDWEVTKKDETAIKNGTFTTGRYVICEYGQKSVLDLPDYSNIDKYGYYILDENTIFAVDKYFGLERSLPIYVFASGVEVTSVKEIEEQRKVEEKKRAVEEEQRKVEEQISIEKQKQDAAKAAIRRRNNSIRKKQNVKLGFLWALFILIAALLIKPAGMFGYRIWQKCGAVIFVNLEISFFLIFIMRSGHWIRCPFPGEEKEENYRSWPCGPFMFLPDNLLDISVNTWVSLIPAVFTTALKIGLILGHPIISCLLSVVLWVVILVVIVEVSDSIPSQKNTKA